MKKIHFVFLNVIISMIAISNVKAQSRIIGKEEARIFVQKFYDWYGTMGALSDTLAKEPDAMMLCLSHKPAYFDDKLREGIIEDRQAEDNSPGEVVGLDFDPIANAQDTRTGFQTGKVQQNGDKFFVDVHDIKRTNTEAVLAAPLVVTAEVVHINGHWEFINFMYPKAEGGDNLLDILKSLKSDRAKWAVEANKQTLLKKQ